MLIARSLVAEPEFILLDEPTANLDVQHALDVLELCQALSRKGKTFIVATHDFNLVTRYATPAGPVAGWKADCARRSGNRP